MKMTPEQITFFYRKVADKFQNVAEDVKNELGLPEVTSEMTQCIYYASLDSACFLGLTNSQTIQKMITDLTESYDIASKTIAAVILAKHQGRDVSPEVIADEIVNSSTKDPSTSN